MYVWTNYYTIQTAVKSLKSGCMINSVARKWKNIILMDLHVVCSVWLNKHKTCNDYNIFLNPFIVIGFIEIKVRESGGEEGVKIHSRALKL